VSFTAPGQLFKPKKKKKKKRKKTKKQKKRQKKTTPPRQIASHRRSLTSHPVASKFFHLQATTSGFSGPSKHSGERKKKKKGKKMKKQAPMIPRTAPVHRACRTQTKQKDKLTHDSHFNQK
jgi:hypothetical protein